MIEEQELQDALARDTRRYIVKLEAEIERQQEQLRAVLKHVEELRAEIVRLKKGPGNDAGA